MAREQDENGFARIALPHLDAAYSLARWLTRDEHLAEDVVQEAYLRAFRFFGNFRGEDAKAWLLAIVRNTFYTLHKQNQVQRLHEPFDDELHDAPVEAGAEGDDPQTLLARFTDAQAIRTAMEALPDEYREVLVLREIEDMSYKEIAAVAKLPIGTVMSRLARARKLLRTNLQCADEGR
ncbi:MAG: sigma-70 family RNA polymerase sigma factor [Betaproteobacteria bacterium]|jgi:RNA polymerase sigma factor (sigma-70 family)